MKKVWLGLAIGAAVVVVAATAAIFFYPSTSWFKDQLATIVKNNTGYVVEFKGRTSLSLWPTITLRTEDVTIRNPPGITGPPLLQAAAVEVDLALSFSSWFPPGVDFVATRIAMPKVQITSDRDDRSNLTGSTAAAAPAKPPSAFALGTVTLTGGTMTYTDARNGVEQRLENVNARISQPSPQSSVHATFDGVWKSERIDGTATLPPLGTLLALESAREPVRAIVALSAKSGRAEFDVLLAPGAALSLSAKSRVNIQSLNELGKWVGTEPDALGTGALAWSGDVSIESLAGKPATEAPAGSARAWQVGVKNGTLTLGERCDRPQCKVEKISATAMVFSTWSAPFETVADLHWNGQRIEARGRVHAPDALLARGSSKATLRIASDRDQLELDGELDRRQAWMYRGRAKGGTTNLRRLAEIMGMHDLPFDTGLENGKLDGDFSAATGKVELRNARISLDDSTAQGDITYDYAGKQPVLGGKLAFDRIDAGRYDARFAAPAPRPSGAAARPGASQLGDRGAASRGGRDPFASTESVSEAVPFISLKESLKTHLQELESGRAAAAPAVTEAPMASGAAWSEDSLGFDVLKNLKLDVNLDLAVGELKVAGRSLAVPQLKTLLKDGRLALEWTDLASHGGKIKGKAQVDGTTAAPTVSAELTAEGVEVDQVLSDLGMRAFLSGKAAASAQLTASGKSEKALISTLSGSFQTSAAGSSVVGWDLRTDWQNIFNRFRQDLGLAPPSPTALTPVERLSAVITIDKGVAETTQAQVSGRQFSADAAGRVRLIARQIDYRGTFSAFVAPELDKIPFRASGHWASPVVGLDWDRFGAVQAIKTFFSIGFSGGGAALESMSSGIDPEMQDLLRRYIDKTEARGPLSPGDAAAVRELRDLLGPAKQ